MEKIKEDIEQIKVQLLTGIKLGRVDKEWGNIIIETCNRALTIPVVVGQSEQLTCPRCKSNNILNPDKDNDPQCIECAFIWAG